MGCPKTTLRADGSGNVQGQPEVDEVGQRAQIPIDLSESGTSRFTGEPGISDVSGDRGGAQRLVDPAIVASAGNSTFPYLLACAFVTVVLILLLNG